MVTVDPFFGGTSSSIAYSHKAASSTPSSRRELSIIRSQYVFFVFVSLVSGILIGGSWQDRGGVDVSCRNLSFPASLKRTDYRSTFSIIRSVILPHFTPVV
ncbi:hypothetical protein BDZ91DRAFT_493219 [Kalaharituber pfeilii]|nr:hypothetical protein BDZ91DRAFT_493219 [Kalaharituber pfeilii]